MSGLARDVCRDPNPRRGEAVMATALERSRAAEDTLAFDAPLVSARLEEAGRTLLALPGTGYSTRLRTSNLDIVRSAAEAYGFATAQLRPPVPPAAQIDRMDEALTWISLIPADRTVLRRIVGARSLVNPLSERHIYSWRRLASVVGADHKAVQRWHAVGIDLIVAALNQTSLVARAYTKKLGSMADTPMKAR